MADLSSQGKLGIVPYDVRRDPLFAPETGIFDEPTRPICVNVEWIPHIGGLLERLVWQDAWLGDDTEKETAIQQIRKLMVALALGNSCMPQFELRQNPDDLCQLQQSLDGGESWILAFDYSLCSVQGISSTELNDALDALEALLEAYDDTVESIAPNMVYDDTDTDDIRDLALCHAVTELINGLCQAELEYRQVVAVTGTIAAAVATVIGILVAIGTLGAGVPVYVAMGLSLTAAGASIFDGISDAILGDSDARNEVICCMVNALNGETIDKTAFEESLDGCAFTGGSNEAQLSGAISNWLTDDDVYESFLDAMQRSYRFAELGIATCNCDIVDDWTFTTNWLDDEHGFEPGVVGANNASSWSIGVGWSSVDIGTGSPGPYRRINYIKIDIPETRITNVTLTYNLTKGTIVDANQNGLVILVEDSNPTSHLKATQFSSLINGSNQIDSYDFDYPDIIQVALSLSSSYNGSAVYSGVAKLVSVSISGIGDNPFV